MASPGSIKEHSCEISAVRRCGLIASKSSALSEANKPLADRATEFMTRTQTTGARFAATDKASIRLRRQCAQSPNIELYRDTVGFIGVERFQEGSRHFMQT